MGNRRHSLPLRHPELFHKCWNCRAVGLKPGILGTKYGEYGMRRAFEDEEELKLNEAGLCTDRVKQLKVES